MVVGGTVSSSSVGAVVAAGWDWEAVGFLGASAGEFVMSMHSQITKTVAAMLATIRAIRKTIRPVFLRWGFFAIGKPP